MLMPKSRVQTSFAIISSLLERWHQVIGESILMGNFQEKANYIWQVADDILRGPFKPHEYADIMNLNILPKRFN